MAEHWNGVRWTLRPTPAPPAGSLDFGLTSMRCPAANSCIAVGSYRLHRGPAIPIAEHWDGSSWTLQTIPGPPGKTFDDFEAGLSCASVDFCLAVGDYGHGLFSDTWNGTGWKAALITRPSTPPPFVDGISCSSPKGCLVIGEGFAENWNGLTWQKLRPAHITGENLPLLTSVSCVSDTDCEVITEPVGNPPEVTAELWNGKKLVYPARPGEDVEHPVRRGAGHFVRQPVRLPRGRQLPDDQGVTGPHYPAGLPLLLSKGSEPCNPIDFWLARWPGWRQQADCS